MFFVLFLFSFSSSLKKKFKHMRNLEARSVKTVKQSPSFQTNIVFFSKPLLRLSVNLLRLPSCSYGTKIAQYETEIAHLPGRNAARFSVVPFEAPSGAGSLGADFAA